MAAAETARLIASLELKDNLSKGIGSATAGVGKLEGKLGGLGAATKRGVGNAIANLKTLGVVSAAVAGGIIVKSIGLASDLAETQSKVQVVFKDSADEVLAFGKTSAQAIGLSQNAALGAVATYGNLFVSMGLGSDKAADMSTKLVTLAGDLASFNNIDPTEAAEKLRAGLTGESEPLKSLGININETIIKAKALELGLVKTGNSTAELKLKTQAMNKAQAEAAAATKKYGANSKQALTATVKAEKAQAALEKTTKTFPGTLDAATKAQAAYALIFEQSATAQGDFARTGEGLANQQRKLRANMDDLGATLGKALLPSVAKLVGKLNELAVKSTPAIEELGAALPGIFDAGVAFVEGIPWDTVALGLQAAGTFAKTLFGIFSAIPPEAQATIVALAGLNKLTGGGVINLGKIAFEQFASRGATPANPLFVSDVSGGLGKLLPGAAGAAAGAGVGGAALAGGGLLAASAAISYAAILNSPQFARSNQLKGKNASLNQAEIAAIKYYEGSAEYQRQAVLHLGKAPTKADYESGQAKLRAAVSGAEVFGPPKGFVGKSGGLSPDERDSQIAAIIARAKAAGRTPHDPVAAAQATLGRNQLREQEKTKAAVDAVKSQEARTTAAVLVAAAAIQNLDRQPPQVNLSVNNYSSAADNVRSIVRRRRIVKPSGSRGGEVAEFG